MKNTPEARARECERKKRIRVDERRKRAALLPALAGPARRYTVEEYAGRIGVKLGTLRRWIHEGQIPVVRDASGTAVAFDSAEADPWVEKKRLRSWAFLRRTVVYFAQSEATGYVKIGFAQDVAARMFELERKSHERVRLLGHVPGDKRLELSFHDLFAYCRVGSSEWFRPEPELLVAIQRRLGVAA